MDEIWKDVKDFEGEYQISNKGRLKHYTKRFGWRILKNTNKKGWYFNVFLRHGNIPSKSVKIHRLVAEAFIPNPNGYRCINHKDENKQNNCVENLEWCSFKQNCQHSLKKRYERGEIYSYNYLEFFNEELFKKTHQLNSKIKRAHPKNKKTTKTIKGKPVIQLTLNNLFVCEYPNCKSASIYTGICCRNICQVASKTPFNSNGSVRKQAGGFIWKFKEDYLNESNNNF